MRLQAHTFGLAPHRGVLAVGAAADVAVFAPESVGDAATFEEPELPSTGIVAVLVAGVVVYSPSMHGSGGDSGARPGRLLRRQDLSAPMAAAATTKQGPGL